MWMISLDQNFYEKPVDYHYYHNLKNPYLLHHFYIKINVLISALPSHYVGFTSFTLASPLFGFRLVSNTQYAHFICIASSFFTATIHHYSFSHIFPVQLFIFLLRPFKSPPPPLLPSLTLSFYHSSLLLGPYRPQSHYYIFSLLFVNFLHSKLPYLMKD